MSRRDWVRAERLTIELGLALYNSVARGRLVSAALKLDPSHGQLVRVQLEMARGAKSCHVKANV
jgi:hypothetical protein